MQRKIYESIEKRGYYADQTQIVVPIPVVLVSDESEALLLRGKTLADARLTQTRLVSEIAANLKEFFETYGSLKDIAELLEELDDFFDELEEDLECECDCTDKADDEELEDEEFDLLDDEDEFSIEALDDDEENELEELIDDVLDDVDDDSEEDEEDDLDKALKENIDCEDEEDYHEEEDEDDQDKIVSENTQAEKNLTKVEKVTKDMNKELSDLIKQIKWNMESNDLKEEIAENDFNLVGEAKKTSLEDLVDDMLEDIIDSDTDTRSYSDIQESNYVKSLFEEFSKKL